METIKLTEEETKNLQMILYYGVASPALKETLARIFDPDREPPKLDPDLFEEKDPNDMPYGFKDRDAMVEHMTSRYKKDLKTALCRVFINPTPKDADANFWEKRIIKYIRSLETGYSKAFQTYLLSTRESIDTEGTIWVKLEPTQT